MTTKKPILECFKNYPYRFEYGDEVTTEFWGDGVVLDILHARTGDACYVLEDEHGETRICHESQLELKSGD